MSRFNFDTPAIIGVLTQSGNKSSYAAGDTINGFFQPIDSDQNTVALGIVGQAYQFVTDGDADIKAAYTLTIDSIEYRVRGVRRNQMKRQDHLTCIMELPLKE